MQVLQNDWFNTIFIAAVSGSINSSVNVELSQFKVLKKKISDRCDL